VQKKAMKIRSFSQHFADRTPADIQAQLHDVLVLLPDLGVPLSAATTSATLDMHAIDLVLRGCERMFDGSLYPKTPGIVMEALLVLQHRFAMVYESGANQGDQASDKYDLWQQLQIGLAAQQPP
jgi:hypothetical protein